MKLFVTVEGVAFVSKIFNQRESIKKTVQIGIAN